MQGLHEPRALVLPLRGAESAVRRRPRGGLRRHPRRRREGQARPADAPRRRGRPRGRPQDLRGAPGHDRRQGPARHRRQRGLPGQLLRAPRPAGALGRGHHGSRAGDRPDDQPAERHLQLHRRGTGGVPQDHEGDRLPRHGLRSRRRLRVRDRPRRRDRLPADHRPGGEPGRDRRPYRRADLRAGAARRPRISPSCSRSARCRSTSTWSARAPSPPPSASRPSTRG